MTATYALRRFSPWQAWRVARTLDYPPEAPEIVVHAPDTAGTLMVTDYPTVEISGQSRAALESLREMKDVNYKFTRVFVLNRLCTQRGRYAGRSGPHHRPGPV